jgi:hypothetical protein
MTKEMKKQIEEVESELRRGTSVEQVRLMGYAEAAIRHCVAEQ